jgi:hypothetical protein
MAGGQNMARPAKSLRIKKRMTFNKILTLHISAECWAFAAHQCDRHLHRHMFNPHHLKIAAQEKYDQSNVVCAAYNLAEDTSRECPLHTIRQSLG